MSENHGNNGGASWSVNLVPVPSFEFLRARFTYDRFTGSLKWKVGKFAGREAGCKQYRRDGTPNAIRVGIQQPDGKLIQYVAHRLIWSMMDGVVAVGLVIDHDDGNPFNNIWKNLVRVTHSKNIFKQKLRNKTRLHTELPRGVYRNPSGTFFSLLRVNGQAIHLGSFSTTDDAKSAYDHASLEHHGIIPT